MEIDTKKVKQGDIFSETSHYIFIDKGLRGFRFQHLESGTTVSIEDSYVRSLLKSGDQYEREVEVTKEDKKDGTPGIRTIFENIHSGQVFTVTFKKQDTPKSKSKFNSEVDALVNNLCKELEGVKASKKGVAKWAKETITALATNPISRIDEGEMRTLRGYKLQFDSRDGKYRCIDMDIKKDSKETGERLVNINTITELIYNGIKYIVE